jgi:hypothetical protein
VFESSNHWAWVTLAWGELILAYGGYLLYLNWRRQKLLRDHENQQSLARSMKGQA